MQQTGKQQTLQKAKQRIKSYQNCRKACGGELKKNLRIRSLLDYAVGVMY